MKRVSFVRRGRGVFLGGFVGSLVRPGRHSSWLFLLPLVLGVALVAAGSRARSDDEGEEYRLS